MQLAVGKAFTAASWATPSGEFTRSTEPGTAAEDEACVVAAAGGLGFD